MNETFTVEHTGGMLVLRHARRAAVGRLIGDAGFVIAWYGFIALFVRPSVSSGSVLLWPALLAPLLAPLLATPAIVRMARIALFGSAYTFDPRTAQAIGSMLGRTVVHRS